MIGKKFGDAEYRFSYDRQCLVRADLYAAELLTKAARMFAAEDGRAFEPLGMEEAAGLAATLNLDQDQPAAEAVTWGPTAEAPATPPEPVAPPRNPLETIDDMLWDLEFVQPDTTDNRVRLEG